MHSSSSSPEPSSIADGDMEAMSRLLTKIQNNVELLTEAGALGILYSRNIRLSGLGISFEPNSGFSSDLASLQGRSARSCRNIQDPSSYHAVLDPRMPAGGLPPPSLAPAFLAHGGMDAFLAEGWSRSAEIICEADARYRMLHGLIQSPMDLSARAELDGHPLSLIPPAELGAFSARREAAATTEICRSSERLEFLLELKEALRAHVDDMRSKDLLIHHISIHLADFPSGVTLSSEAYYESFVDGSYRVVAFIPPAAQPLGKIFIALNPLDADLADDVGWTCQCAAIAAVGRPAYIEGLWREIEPQIIAAGDRLCAALGLPPPAGLIALREREALEAAVPNSASPRRKGPL